MKGRRVGRAEGEYSGPCISISHVFGECAVDILKELRIQGSKTQPQRLYPSHKWYEDQILSWAGLRIILLA